MLLTASTASVFTTKLEKRMIQTLSQQEQQGSKRYIADGCKCFLSLQLQATYTNQKDEWILKCSALELLGSCGHLDRMQRSQCIIRSAWSFIFEIPRGALFFHSRGARHAHSSLVSRLLVATVCVYRYSSERETQYRCKD